LNQISEGKAKTAENTLPDALHCHRLI